MKKLTLVSILILLTACASNQVTSTTPNAHHSITTLELDEILQEEYSWHARYSIQDPFLDEIFYYSIANPDIMELWLYQNQSGNTDQSRTLLYSESQTVTDYTPAWTLMEVTEETIIFLEEPNDNSPGPCANKWLTYKNPILNLFSINKDGTNKQPYVLSNKRIQEIQNEVDQCEEDFRSTN
jgi:hypothetical protein